MYGESLLGPRHPVVVPRQLVGRVDPLEGEVLSLVLSQAAHTCQPCSHHHEVSDSTTDSPDSARMLEEEAELWRYLEAGAGSPDDWRYRELLVESAGACRNLEPAVAGPVAGSPED